MTMAISRRPARKSEPNLNSLRPTIESSPSRRGNDSSRESSTEKRRRPWFWTSSRPSPMTATMPLSPASLYRPKSLPRLLMDRLKHYRKSVNPIYAGMTFVCSIWLIKWWLLGPRGSIKGGALGGLLDLYHRDQMRHNTILMWRKEVRDELNIPIVYKESKGSLLEPRYYPLDVKIESRPNCAIVEMLLREKRRIQKLESMIRTANVLMESCSEHEDYLVSIPTTILQLIPDYEQPSLPPYWITRSSSFDINSIAIRNSDISPLLLRAIKSCQALFSSGDNAISDDTDLQCVGHYLGGLRLSKHFALRQSRPAIRTIFSLMDKKEQSLNELVQGNCNSRVGYAVFSNSPTPDDQLRKTSAISSRVSTVFTAFPPNHPGSLCIPPLEHSIGISPYNEANEELSLQSTFANKLLTGIESGNFKNNSSAWGIATLPCNSDHITESTMSMCCKGASVSILDSISKEGIARHIKNERGHQSNNKQKHHIIFTFSMLIPPTSDEDTPGTEINSVSVKINEHSNSRSPARRQKESIQTKLRNTWRCEPGWLCNRCLQSPLHGSFSSCASICSKCAANAICNKHDDSSTSKQVKIDVQVAGFNSLPSSSILTGHQNRIPRIIHQTYFEEITIEKYPQLCRVRNTWIASGWEYKFYTDDTARQYINDNYPSRFVSVFDALLPGAYKADYFRYLVLYKEGGIYVDVDVMLNTNLDSFIAPDLAFFVPLDAVGNFADEQYCLWNGLLGSAPGHPALTNVIEWMVNLVSNRGDMYDMERAVCGYSGIDKIENWKVRAEPGLTLSGPCALGFAINNALGNEPLSKFRAGLLRREEFNAKNMQDINSDAIGDVMFLEADKDDLGAFRFTDPERNVIIASTDLAGLSKSPMIYDSGHLRGKPKQKPHYSVSTRGERLWGTHDVYTDDLVEDEQISLIVSYK